MSLSQMNTGGLHEDVELREDVSRLPSDLWMKWGNTGSFKARPPFTSCWCGSLPALDMV